MKKASPKKKAKKICDYCHEPYKRRAQVIVLFGGKFCLHDEPLENFHRLGSNAPSTSIDVKEAKDGRNSAEQKYIEQNNRKGHTVVRGSDGILRAVGKK